MYLVLAVRGIVANDVLPPEVETVTKARRMRLTPTDFLTQGYTAGCPGCFNLRRKSVKSRNYSEGCRLRMKGCLDTTTEGRARKERESAGREDDPTNVLRAEDAKI